MSKHPVAVKFHNPSVQTVRFFLVPHEHESRQDYEVEPGEEVEVPGELAYAVPSLAPQLKEGPAPKQAAKPAPPKQ